MSRDETHDAACRWAFRKTFRCSPTPDELRDYKLALDERDRLGLNDALPIFSRLRSVAVLTPAEAARAERQQKAKKNDTPPAPGISGNPEPSPKRRGRPPRGQRAQTLLREQLAGGPKLGVLVEAAAEKADIAKAELIRATDALGVRTKRGQWWLPG